MRRHLAILFGLLCNIHATSAETRIEISSEAVMLNSRDAIQQQVGKLHYRGGLVLRSVDPHFGGFSAVHVSGDGATLMAVSDRGAWITARLRYDSGGRLIGVQDGRRGLLIGENGKVLMYRDTDAEALVVLPDRSMLVALERNHRILHYPAASPPFSKAPRRLHAPPEIEKAPPNAGLEALTHVGGGTIVAIAEILSLPDGSRLAWLNRGEGWERFSYVAAPGFRVSDAGTMPNNDVIVLEHHYNFLMGHIVRLVHVKRGSIAPGRRVQGDELATLSAPLTVDNFEGVAIWRSNGEKTNLFLISDDNFNPNQRTLLLMFEISN